MKRLILTAFSAAAFSVAGSYALNHWAGGVIFFMAWTLTYLTYRITTDPIEGGGR